jgi:hypothetical protein
MYDCTGRVNNTPFEMIREIAKMRMKPPSYKPLATPFMPPIIPSTSLLLELPGLRNPVVEPIAFDLVSTNSSNHSRDVEAAIEILRDNFFQLTNKTESHISELRSQIHGESAALCKLFDALRFSLDNYQTKVEFLASPVQIDRTVITNTAQPPGILGLLVLLPIKSPDFSNNQIFSIRIALANRSTASPVFITLKCNGDLNEECTVFETRLDADGMSYVINGSITHSFTGLQCCLNNYPFVASVRLPFAEVHTVELYASSEVNSIVTVQETVLEVQRNVSWVSHNKTACNE